ncbi:MAG: Rap1a/Tai family immunity protein [Alphaproteobacteria bacterium]
MIRRAYKKPLFLCCMVFLLSLTISTQTHAAHFSGEYLHKVCSVDKAGKELIQGGKIACQSYIAGVIDYHNMLKSMDLTSDMNFCVPEDISLNELQLKVLFYLSKRNKLHRKFVAAPAVTMALYSFYPCK